MSDKSKTKPYKNIHWMYRAAVLAVIDFVLMVLSFLAALLIRYDFSFSKIESLYIEQSFIVIPICAVLIILLLGFFKMYNSIWRFASFSEFARIVKAWLLFSVIVFVIEVIDERITEVRRLPISVWVMAVIFGFVSTTALRFGFRFISYLNKERAITKNCSNIMIVGAGACGKDVIHEIVMSKHVNARVCCAIDDNPVKLGREIDGVPIVGNRHDIPIVVEDYKIDEIVFAIPDARGVDKKEILDICSTTGCKVRVIPGIYQMIDGTVTVNTIRNVQIEALLGRDPVNANVDKIREYITGKTVMVTGGGGSIGSELCRQIAMAKPKLLIIFDIYENNAFWIERELREKYGDSLNMVALI